MLEKESLVVSDKENLKLMNVWSKKAKNAVLHFWFRKENADLNQNFVPKRQVWHEKEKFWC